MRNIVTFGKLCRVLFGMRRRLSVLLAVLAICSLSLSTNAATATWTGMLNSDWGTAANWSLLAVPGSADEAVVPTSPTGGRFPILASGTFAVGKLTVQSGATVTHTGGTITIGDLTLNSGGTYSQSGGLVKINPFWRNNGTFTATGGTVQFTGDPGVGGAGDFGGVNQFYHVIIDPGIDPRFAKIANASISIAGDFFNYNTTLDTGANATFTFNGTGDQAIYSVSSSPTFGKVVINKPSGTLTLTSHLIIAGNLTVNDGTLDLGPYTLRRKSAGASFVMNGDAVLKVGAAFPSNFGTVTLGSGTTVEYYGSDQTVAGGFTYGKLTLSGSGTKTADANLTVADTLTIDSGVTLNMSSFALNVYRTITNNGTIISSKPYITGVTVPATTMIDVLFSEAVELVSSQTLSNYVVNNGVTVTLAQRDSGNNALVHLTVSALADGTEYMLTVNNVTDLTGNVVATNAIRFTRMSAAATDFVTLALARVGASFRLTGSGTPGRMYRLQFTDTLTPVNWQDLPGGNVTADTTGTFEFTETSAAPVRFYRVLYP